MCPSLVLMRFISKIALFLVAATVVWPAGVTVAQSGAEYIGLVKVRCEAVKQLVDEQRRSDLVARINKGRAYQEIIDQQNAFSIRLRNNRLTSDAFDRQLAVVQAGVNNFRNAYNTYDDSVVALLDIDCKTEPQEFVDQLAKVKVQRNSIGVEVAKVGTELARYRQEVVEFKQEIKRLNESVLGESQ